MMAMLMMIPPHCIAAPMRPLSQVPSLPLTSSCVLCSTRTVHRLLLAGVVVASKAHEERFGDNLWYAKAGGIPLDELNKLELAFLGYIGWCAALPRPCGPKVFRLNIQYTISNCT